MYILLERYKYIIAIRIEKNLKTQEVVETSKIIYFKIPAERLFEVRYTSNITSNDYHIIHINKKKCDTTVFFRIKSLGLEALKSKPNFLIELYFPP